MPRCFRIGAQSSIVVISSVTVLSSVANAGTLRKVWEFHTNVVPGLENPDAPLGVFALGFSRDGQQIAAVVGHSSNKESLLIIVAHDPQSHPVKLDVNPQIWDQEPGAGKKRIEWSPDGRQLILANRIVQVSTGTSCSMPVAAPKFTGFAQVSGHQAKPSKIVSFDLGCHVIRTWKVPDGKTVESLDASAERGLLFITARKISQRSVTDISQAIIDANSWKILRELTRSKAPTALSAPVPVFGNPMFADAGKAFCWTSGEIWQTSIACSAVDLDKTLGQSNGWKDPGIRTALKASRLVISDYSKKLDWIDLHWYPGSLRKRVVWDFRSSKELVRWSPKIQKVLIQTSPSVQPLVLTSHPYRFDISPDGEYIVEGGAGVVSLYKIEP